MPRSSQRFPHSTGPAFPLIAVLLLGIVPGCARSAARSEPSVALAPATSPTSDDASKVIEKRPDEPLASLLSRAPGVLVTEFPDGSFSVRIRAASSFYASSDPLYVVDGSPVTTGPEGRLRGISPHDVQSIQVLRYPPETSLYGVRGANGVIVVKTKRLPPREP